MWKLYPVFTGVKVWGFIKSDTRPVITTNYLVIVLLPFKVKVSGDNSLFLITYFRENYFVFTCYFLISWPPNKSLVPVGLPCEPIPREQPLDAINHWQWIIYSVSHTCRHTTRCGPCLQALKCSPWSEASNTLANSQKITDDGIHSYEQIHPPMPQTKPLYSFNEELKDWLILWPLKWRNDSQVPGTPSWQCLLPPSIDHWGSNASYEVTRAKQDHFFHGLFFSLKDTVSHKSHGMGNLGIPW